ncbi:MAG: cytochrome c oxidase assembly protein [Gammaproteobacteria bacterium]|nr:MAG: cytochrome c oxidase assembly protein [Gammaproteobacteria bacterium]
MNPRAPVRTALKLLAMTAAMFGFGYALVPLYDVICDITGLNGKTGRIEQAAAEAQGPDTSRSVTVRFVTSVNAGGAWRFEPAVPSMTVHPGGVYQAVFVAENTRPRAVVGQAVPSVVPREGSLYFKKTECFCFTRQPFAAGERRELPVRFVVDRRLPEHIDTLVLSYTFFDVTPDEGSS